MSTGGAVRTFKGARLQPGFPLISQHHPSFALMFLPPSPHRQGKPCERRDHGHGVGGQGRDPECRQNFIYRHIALLSEGAARARTLLARAGIVARAGRRRQQGWLQACPRRPSAKTGHEKCKKTGALYSFAVSFAHRGETSPAFPQVNHIVRATPAFREPAELCISRKKLHFSHAGLALFPPPADGPQNEPGAGRNDRVDPKAEPRSPQTSGCPHL